MGKHMGFVNSVLTWASLFDREMLMAREPRIHFPGALYHVITGGNRRQGVFLDEKDFKTVPAYLSDCNNRYHFRIYAYWAG